jgi:hypothetical protein
MSAFPELDHQADPGQRRTALGFLVFRASGPSCENHPVPDCCCPQCQETGQWDSETIRRASAMLRAGRDDPMSVRMMGLTEADLDAWDRP